MSFFTAKREPVNLLVYQPLQICRMLLVTRNQGWGMWMPEERTRLMITYTPLDAVTLHVLVRRHPSGNFDWGGWAWFQGYLRAGGTNLTRITGQAVVNRRRIISTGLFVGFLAIMLCGVAYVSGLKLGLILVLGLWIVLVSSVMARYWIKAHLEAAHLEARVVQTLNVR
jgi:hypothetical protein